MLAHAVRALTAGMDTLQGTISATAAPGRFPEEQRLTVYLTADNAAARLLTVTVYHGWKWYAPWAELTAINGTISLGTQHLTYHGSPIETRLISLFADAIRPPAHIFISYQTDHETARALAHDVPAPATRLGYMLFTRGFTWYKDWYHPEGWMEGDQKLQAEKPLDIQHRQRHHKAIKRDITAYLTTDTTNTDITRTARQRAHHILEHLRRHTR